MTYKNIITGISPGERKRLLSAANELYWHEAAKPEAERDLCLMDECLATIKQLVREPKRSACRKTFATGAAKLRKTAAVLCSIILVISLSIGIAYAAGVDVWGIIISGKNGQLIIDGRTETTLPLSTDMPSETEPLPTNDVVGYTKFSSISEALNNLCINPCILDLTNVGLSAHNILGARGTANISLVIDYASENGDEYLYYAVDYYPADGQSAFNKTIAAAGENMTTFTCNDVTHYIIYGDETVIIWFTDNTLYQVSTSLDAKTLETLVRSLY